MVNYNIVAHTFAMSFLFLYSFSMSSEYSLTAECEIFLSASCTVSIIVGTYKRNKVFYGDQIMYTVCLYLPENHNILSCVSNPYPVSRHCFFESYLSI